jgi:hypothetical protein
MVPPITGSVAIIDRGRSARLECPIRPAEASGRLLWQNGVGGDGRRLRGSADCAHSSSNGGTR